MNNNDNDGNDNINNNDRCDDNDHNVDDDDDANEEEEEEREEEEGQEERLRVTMTMTMKTIKAITLTTTKTIIHAIYCRARLHRILVYTPKETCILIVVLSLRNAVYCHKHPVPKYDILTLTVYKTKKKCYRRYYNMHCMPAVKSPSHNLFADSLFGKNTIGST